jgi:hypothetical protein
MKKLLIFVAVSASLPGGKGLNAANETLKTPFFRKLGSVYTQPPLFDPAIFGFFGSK